MRVVVRVLCLMPSQTKASMQRASHACVLHTQSHRETPHTPLHSLSFSPSYTHIHTYLGILFAQGWPEGLEEGLELRHQVNGVIARACDGGGGGSGVSVRGGMLGRESVKRREGPKESFFLYGCTCTHLVRLAVWPPGWSATPPAGWRACRRFLRRTWRSPGRRWRI